MSTRKSISVVASAYNEELCVAELVRRLKDLAHKEPNYSWQFIIVDNGSTDQTWKLLQDLCSGSPDFVLLRLSRNFKMAGGLLAGLDEASGDACVLMAADLQDPPELISSFLREWEAGAENVGGIVVKRHGTPTIRRLNSIAFYRILNLLTAGQVPINVSDFRLLDRKVYRSLTQLPERKRFLRGSIAWLGFDFVGIEFERPARQAGSSKASTRGVLALARLAIVSHSIVPLRLTALAGLFLGIIALMVLVTLVVNWLVQGVPFGGFGTIVGILLLLFAVQFIFLAIIGEYLSAVLEETRRRPEYVVSQVVTPDSGD